MTLLKTAVMFSGAAALVLACRASPAMHPVVLRPAAPAPAETSAPATAPRDWEAAPPLELVALPSWIRYVSWDFAPDLAEAMPAIDSPPIPTPTRPHAGGDALRLADLALARHDARDAAAQYRALLRHADPTVRSYVELQLARAYVEQGDRAQAVPLLRHILTSDSAATWPAVLELASIDIVDHEPVDVLRALEPYAGDRLRLLEDHVMALAFDDQMPRLLEVVLPRNDDPARACVIERRRPPTPVTARLPQWRLCPVVSPGKSVRSGKPNRQSAMLHLVYMEWSSRLLRTPLDSVAWTELAVRAADATMGAPDSPLAEITSWAVVGAALNASLVSTRRGAVVTLPQHQLDRIRGGVIVPHREYLDPIIASWLTRESSP